MSLLLAGLVIAGTSGAVSLGRWLARRRAEPAKTDDAADPDEARAREEVDADVPASKDDSEPKVDAKPPPATASTSHRVEGFVCQLGDVVMRHTGEEAWLAGGVILSEDVPVAILFVAPEAGHDRVLFARASDKRRLVWLEPLDSKAVLVGGDPPSAVEHGGVRFDRVRRLPLRARRIGVGAPNFGDAVMVAEYTSPGAERLLAFKGNAGAVLCYRGLELEEGAFEVIASGDATL